MGIRESVDELGEVINNEELTPRFMMILIGITAGFLISFGIIAYIIVFVILGY